MQATQFLQSIIFQHRIHRRNVLYSHKHNPRARGHCATSCTVLQLTFLLATDTFLSYLRNTLFDWVLGCLICNLTPYSASERVSCQTEYFGLKLYICLLQTGGEEATSSDKIGSYLQKKDIPHCFSQVMYRNTIQWRMDENAIPNPTLASLPWLEPQTN